MNVPCRVVNKYKEEYDYYIGRGSILGNPFTLEDYSHNECIAYHRLYLCYAFIRIESVRALISELSKRSNLTIGCFCKPKECHGDFICQLITDYHVIRDMNHEALLAHYGIEKTLVRMPVLGIDMSTLRSPRDTIMLVKKELTAANNTCFVSRVMAYLLMENSHCIHHRIFSITAYAILRDFAGFKYTKEASADSLCEGLSQLYEFNMCNLLNAYSGSDDRLGFLLSNFAQTPFDHPVHGKFESVEGWWYWYGAGGDERLRAMYGYTAKKFGAGLTRVHRPDMIAQLESVLECKIASSSELQTLLKTNTLPIVHHYTYGGGVVWPKHVEFINTLTLVVDRFIGIR